MSDDTILRASRQLWKLYLSFALSAVGFCLIMMPLTGSVEVSGNYPILLVAGGLVLSVAAVIWASVSIKCPQCKAKLLWMALKKQSHQSWLTWVVSLSKCPVCGYTSDPEARQHQ